MKRTRPHAAKRNVPVVDGEGYLKGVLEKVLEDDPAYAGLKEWAVGKYTALALEKDPRLHVFNDNCHANPEGYRLLAELVAKTVIRECFEGK